MFCEEDLTVLLLWKDKLPLWICLWFTVGAEEVPGARARTRSKTRLPASTPPSTRCRGPHDWVLPPAGVSEGRRIDGYVTVCLVESGASRVGANPLWRSRGCLDGS